MTKTQKYDDFMTSMRAKLDNPPYSGNKSEAYRAGIKAAMSKVKDLYDPKADHEIEGRILPSAVFIMKSRAVVTVLSVMPAGQYSERKPDGNLETVRYDIDRIMTHWNYDNSGPLRQPPVAARRERIIVMTREDFIEMIRDYENKGMPA